MGLFGTIAKIGGGLAGAALGGPIGLAAGGLAGSLLSKKKKKKNAAAQGEDGVASGVQASITGTPSLTPQPVANTPVPAAGLGLGGAGAVTATTPAPAPAPLPSMSERVGTIIDSGSPLMRRAETYGRQQLNRRGLGNSSMAVEAGQAAVLDAAVPIASQDATMAQQDNLAGRQEALSLNMLTRELSARERDNLAATISQMNATQLEALAATLNNPDIPAATRAAMQQAIQAQTQSGINFLQNLYGVSVSNATPTPATTPASGLGAYLPSSNYGVG